MGRGVWGPQGPVAMSFMDNFTLEAHLGIDDQSALVELEGLIGRPVVPKDKSQRYALVGSASRCFSALTPLTGH